MVPFRPHLSALILALACTGAARAQAHRNVIFHSNLDQHAGYSDIWGYTAPNGDEYALLGTWNGLAVINVTDPTAPYETGYLPGQYSPWRDIKTYQHWAYVTNEAGGGLAIVDLSDPENPVALPPYTGFGRAHNLYIDEAAARCYIAGSDLGIGGVRILSLANPTSPVEIGSWENEYVHDVVAQAGRLYCSAIYVAQLEILDVSNPASIPPPLGVIQGYPLAFTHNSWMTADGNFVMTTDEKPGAAVRMWDITNVANPVQADLYQPNPAGAPHNVVIDGNQAYVSHYTAGVRVVDITDPYAMQELGYYDTYPANDGSTFDGCWGVFPLFGTTPGLFVASDIQTGLYVLEYRGPLGAVSGRVVESGTSTGVAGARVSVVETGVSVLADSTGAYTLEDTGGAVTLQAEAFGYQTSTWPVTITVGTTVPLDLPLSPLASGTLSGLVFDANTALPVPGALVELQGTPLVQVADAAGNYEHDAVPSGTYTVAVSAFGYDTRLADVTMSFGASLTVDFGLTPAISASDFEVADPGWTVSGDAVTGQWERADPEGTFEGSQPVQPEDDHTVAGTDCWVTGPLAGAAVGQYDVDGGETVLTTPVFDVSSLSAPRVSYWRWYSTGYGNPTTDDWTVEVSSDAGTSWTLVERIGQPKPQWNLVDVALDSLVVPSSAVRFRFTARDTGDGSITEAAIDDFMVYDTRAATGTAVTTGPAPTAMLLSQAYPNPARGGQTVHLSLSLPEPGRVEAVVFDVAGRRVAVLERGRMAAGPHRIGWDGRLANGSSASSGVYFIRLDSDAGRRSRRVVLVR